MTMLADTTFDEFWCFRSWTVRLPTCRAKLESTQLVAETKAWLMICLYQWSVRCKRRAGYYDRPSVNSSSTQWDPQKFGAEQVHPDLLHF